MAEPRYEAVVAAAVVGTAVEKGWLEGGSISFNLPGLRERLGGGVRLSRDAAVQAAVELMELPQTGGVEGDAGDREVLGRVLGLAFDELVRNVEDR